MSGAGRPHRRALVVGLASLLAVGLGSAARGATPPTTVVPGQLTIGVSLPSEGFQVGSVVGTRVVWAQGLEIDLARALAKQLGLANVAFVQSRFDRLYSAGPKQWDAAIAEITVTDARARTVDFTQSYMTVDQGVLLTQTRASTRRTIAGLKPLQLCALRKSTGADVVTTTIAPSKPVRLVGNVSTLMLDLQTGKCEAVVYDAPALGTLKSRAPLRYGPFAGVIETGERYGIAVAKGSTLLPQLNAALARLIVDGTITRLQKKWLTVDLSRVPTLR